MKDDLQILLKFFDIKSREKRKAAFLAFSKNDINILTEITYNLLSGKVTLSDNTKAKLKKRADWIRKFANKNLPLKRKIKLLINHPTVYTQVFRILLPMAIDYFQTQTEE